MSISRPASPVSGNAVVPARLLRAELVHVAKGLHETQVLVARQAWTQAEGDPPSGDFVLQGHEGDAEAANTVLSAFTHTLGIRNATEDLAYRFPDHGPEMGPQEWTFLQDRVFTITDTGFDHLSPYGHEHLDPILEEVRGTLRQLSSGAVNTVAAGQRLAGDYAGLYKDWEYVRLARTEMAHAWEVGREHVLTNVFGAQRGHYSKVAEDFELKFGGIPVHPNCNCASDVIEGPDGNLYMMIRPNPSACFLCNEVADEILAAIEGVERLPFVPDDEQVAAGIVYAGPDAPPVAPPVGVAKPPAARPSVTTETIPPVNDRVSISEPPRESEYRRKGPSVEEYQAKTKEYWEKVLSGDVTASRQVVRRSVPSLRLMDDASLDRMIAETRGIIQGKGLRGIHGAPRVEDFYRTDEAVSALWKRYEEAYNSNAVGFKGKKADKFHAGVAWGDAGPMEKGDRLVSDANYEWRRFLERKNKGFKKFLNEGAAGDRKKAWEKWWDETAPRTAGVIEHGLPAGDAGYTAAQKAFEQRRNGFAEIDKAFGDGDLNPLQRRAQLAKKKLLTEEIADAYFDGAAVRSHEDAQRRARASVSAWGVDPKYKKGAEKAAYRIYRLSCDEVADGLHDSNVEYRQAEDARAQAIAPVYDKAGKLLQRAKVDAHSDTSDATHLHELLHVVEDLYATGNDPKGRGRRATAIGAAIRDLYADDPEDVKNFGSGYKTNEKYIVGPWRERYTGKVYADYGATEVLSMAGSHAAGIGTLLSNGSEFDSFTKDDHLAFLLGVLRGALERPEAD